MGKTETSGTRRSTPVLSDLEKLTNGARGRHARLDRCRTCRRRILTGPDADIAALPATADPTELTVAEELRATLARITTYTATVTGDRIALLRRDVDTYTAKRSLYDVLKIAVIPAHHCHIVWPPRPPAKVKYDPDKPPF